MHPWVEGSKGEVAATHAFGDPGGAGGEGERADGVGADGGEAAVDPVALVDGRGVEALLNLHQCAVGMCTAPQGTRIGHFQVHTDTGQAEKRLGLLVRQELPHLITDLTCLLDDH